MNQRIRELADEAAKFSAIMALPTGEAGNSLFVEKFAELIVKKCAERLLHDVKLTDIQTTRCVASIKEHFGVEE